MRNEREIQLIRVNEPLTLAVKMTLEALESRTLLSVSASEAGYFERIAYLYNPQNGHGIAGLNQGGDHKSARRSSTPNPTTVDGVDPRLGPSLTSPKISRDLAQLYDEYNGFLVAKTRGAGAFTSLNRAIQVREDRVLISAIAAGSQGGRLLANLQALGMLNARSTDTLVEGELPIVSLRGLIALKSLGSASALYAPEVGASTQTAAPNPTSVSDPADPLGLTQIKSGPLGKLGVDLARTANEYKVFESSGSTGAFRPSIATLPLSGDSVLVQAIASGDVKELQSDLIQLGLRNDLAGSGSVEGYLPFSALAAAASLSSLQSLSPEYVVSAAGAITSQGDLAQVSNLARSDFSLTGAGTTVGVLSNSFNHLGGYSSDVSSGDLPSGVNILSDSALMTDTDEGRAMLQIVHDVAPGASLAFSTGNGGILAMASHIHDLANAGADVIVDDLLYPTEPMFQDGQITQAVDQVVGQGVAYFSAAQNNARNAYESAWNGGSTAKIGGRAHSRP